MEYFKGRNLWGLLQNQGRWGFQRRAMHLVAVCAQLPRRRNQISKQSPSLAAELLKKLCLVFLLSCILLLASCAGVVEQYQASLNNINMLKKYQHKFHNKIALAQFTNVHMPKTKILCRLDSTVSLATGKTFQSYIRDALVRELKYADLYDSRSPIKLYGRVDQINFFSVPGKGKWTIAMTFRINNGSRFKVRSVYHFSMSLIEDKGCEEVAQAFELAVQTFLSRLYSQPQFKKLLTARTNISKRRPAR